MLKPLPLRPGDEIRIVSPASPILEEKLTFATSWLEDRGYVVTRGKHLLDSQAYLAGSDADRAADLNEAFSDSKVRAVLCSRGGYGCARLLPHLDLGMMARSGKMFMGFSDVTTLHLALNQLGLATFHSPMAITLSVPREPWVIESFEKCLEGGDPVPEGSPVGTCVVEGTAEGPVTGGCLCLLTDSIGTQFPVDPSGKILLIEDVDENPHRVDAMLTHLVNGGLLDEVAGIVVGEMTGTDERSDPTIGPRAWREIVRDILGPLGKPLIIDFPFGHRKAGMLTLPLGIRARLDASLGRLTYLERPCA